MVMCVPAQLSESFERVAGGGKSPSPCACEVEGTVEGLQGVTSGGWRIRSSMISFERLREKN